MSSPRPRNGYVLVRVIEEDETRGRLIVPSGVAPFPLRGIVMYVDESWRLRDGSEQDLRAGDEVLFFKNDTTELRMGEEKLTLIHESNIVCVTDPVANLAHRSEH